MGLTAAVSGALTQAGISANVVAAYYHDTFSCPAADAERAVQMLRALSHGNRERRMKLPLAHSPRQVAGSGTRAVAPSLNEIPPDPLFEALLEDLRLSLESLDPGGGDPLAFAYSRGREVEDGLQRLLPTRAIQVQVEAPVIEWIVRRDRPGFFADVLRRIARAGMLDEAGIS